MYTANKGKDRALIYSRLRSMGFSVMADAVHTKASWFRENYPGKNHRAFYLDPFLIGLVKDINFEIMGVPDFIVWFSENSELDQTKWGVVAAYLQVCLNGGECPEPTITAAKAFLGTHITPICLAQPQEVVGEDGLTVVRDMNDYYYQFHDYKFPGDKVIYSVQKPYVKDPFTIVIEDFSKDNGRRFFTDLFACPEWGRDLMDNTFLSQLWEELKMDGPFNINDLLKARTAEFMPNGEDCPLVEPRVLRKSISDIVRK